LKKIGFICTICFLVFLSCHEEEQTDPLPPIDFLVDLTLDLHLAEGPMLRVGHNQRDSIGLILRKKIAGKHGISHEYLEEIMTRLQLDPVLNVQVYDSVVIRLAKLQSQKSKLE